VSDDEGSGRRQQAGRPVEEEREAHGDRAVALLEADVHQRLADARAEDCSLERGVERYLAVLLG